MVSTRFTLALYSLLASSYASALSWNTTKYLFVFGDSYTASGYNVSAGINSPNPGWTSSNGPNWPMYLASTYNVTNTKASILKESHILILTIPKQLYNLAYGGATIDSKLVTPYLPTVQSVVDQIGLWVKYFGPHPSAAPWTSADSLFAIWIGINDIGNSYWWSNVTQADFHKTLLDRYFSQVDILYKKGARSFLFVNVPPLERTPLFISQGQWSIDTVKASVADFNTQLAMRVKNFTATYKGLDQITVYDSNKLFNSQLDNADVLGFVNTTGYNDAYQNGTPGSTYQIPGSKPVSSYFWLNSLHPTFFVHNIMAHALSTILA